MSELQSIIDKYDMKQHPEGGYYVETYRSEQLVYLNNSKHEGDKITNNDTDLIQRSASTSILFLITPGNVSRLHRITSDEVWHFYCGGPMTVVEVGCDDSTGNGYKLTTLGSNIMNNEQIQYCVKANTWFGSYPNEGTSFSLVGCTVAPGFEFQDFELASRSKLIAEYPDAEGIIEKLTIGLP